MWEQLVPPILLKLFERLFKNISKDDAYHKKERRQLANEIRKIQAEAETNGFQNEPRDYEHVTSLINWAQEIDPDRSPLLERFIIRWYLYQGGINKRRKSSIPFYETERSRELGEELRELSQQMIHWIRDLKK